MYAWSLMRKNMPAILSCLFFPQAVPQHSSAAKNKGPVTRFNIVPSLIHKLQQRVCHKFQPKLSQFIYFNIYFVRSIDDPMMNYTQSLSLRNLSPHGEQLE